MAGVVEALGTGVEGARVAAPMIAAGIFFGGYAEYAVVDANLIVPIPSNLSFEQATALMVQGLTAVFPTKQAPPEGKTILITAAAGGVGSLFIQLARSAGARKIIAAASNKNKPEPAKSSGADEGVDYTKADWADRDLCSVEYPKSSIGRRRAQAADFQ